MSVMKSVSLKISDVSGTCGGDEQCISSLSNQPGVSQFSQLLGGDKKTIISSQCNVYSGESFNGAC